MGNKHRFTIYDTPDEFLIAYLESVQDLYKYMKDIDAKDLPDDSKLLQMIGITRRWFLNNGLLKI